jgi:5'-methylthioadenosine phosphorylase
MRSLGVRTVLGPCAVGSLRPDIEPGSFVVLDQLVDRTRGRDDTYYDGDQVHHISFADPYCPVGRTHALAAAKAVGVTVHDGGTIVVINGPRFSTRAESRWYGAQGWDVVGMTQYPEAYLARELGMHYTGIALVTDYDTGVEDDPGIEPVTMEQVFAVMDANVGRVRELLHALVPELPVDPTVCNCASAVGPLPHA